MAAAATAVIPPSYQGHSRWPDGFRRGARGFPCCTMRRAAPLEAYGLNGRAASIGALRVSVGAVLPRRKACDCLQRSRALCTALLLLGVARGRAADLEPP